MSCDRLCLRNESIAGPLSVPRGFMVVLIDIDAPYVNVSTKDVARRIDRRQH